MAVVRSIRFDRNAKVDPAAPTTTHNWYEDASGVLSSGFWASKPNRAEVDYTEDEFCYILEGKVRLTDAAGRTRSTRPATPSSSPRVSPACGKRSSRCGSSM